jgi:uncharacterized protein (TIGR02147 family)
MSGGNSEKISIDYRWMLRNVLLTRLAKNSNYSSRALARDLEISSSFLSQVLSGRRNLSEASGLRIANKLNWSQADQDLFLAMIRFELTTDPDLRQRLGEEINLLKPNLEQFRVLSKDHFEALSSWYHFAIIERTKIPGAEMTAKAIAAAFGITSEDAARALDRLFRLGMLIESAEGPIANDDNYGVPAVPSHGIRDFHRQHLRLASIAIQEQEISQRDFSGITMAIDPASLPEARIIIKKFRRDMMKLLEKRAKVAVYHLAVQLYRLDGHDDHDDHDDHDGEPNASPDQI